MNKPKEDLAEEYCIQHGFNFTAYIFSDAFIAGYDSGVTAERERAKVLLEVVREVLNDQELPPALAHLGNRAIAAIAISQYLGEQEKEK